MCIEIAAQMIFMGAQQFPQGVVYASCVGNHDLFSTPHGIRACLAQMFKHERSTVTIEPVASDYFVRDFGESRLVGFHGHRGSPFKRQHVFAASLTPDKRYTVCLSGHRHTSEEATFGSSDSLIRCIRLPPLCSADSSSRSSLFASAPGMQAFCLEAQGGEWARYTATPTGKKVEETSTPKRHKARRKSKYAPLSPYIPIIASGRCDSNIR
jgi:hypothetical protein